MTNHDTPESTLGEDTDEKETTPESTPETDHEEETPEPSPESDPEADSDYVRRRGFVSSSGPEPESESESPRKEPKPSRKPQQEMRKEIEMGPAIESDTDDSEDEPDSRTDGGNDTSDDSSNSGGGMNVIFDDADVQKWGFIAFIGFEAICATLIVFTTYLIFTHGVHHIPWWMLVGVGVLIIAFLAAAFGGLVAGELPHPTARLSARA